MRSYELHLSFFWQIAAMNRIERAKRLGRLAAPLATSQVSDMITVAADTVMVGALGTTALAAVSLSASSATILMLFGIGYNVAITPLVASAWGKADLEGARSALQAGARISVIAALVLVASMLAVSPFLSVLGAPADVTEAAIPYFRWYVGSFLFRLLFGIFKQTSEAIGNTKLPMLIALTTNLLNIFCNWLLIWGIGGLPAMGVEGAGLATFISRVVGLVIAWYLWKSLDGFRLLREARSMREQVSSAARKIWRSGTAIGAQITMEVVAFSAGGIMIGWIGATELASHQIALNIGSITFMVALAGGSAATVTVAQARGRSDWTEVRAEAFTAIVFVTMFELVTALGIILMRGILPAIYIDDPSVIALAGILLIYVAAFQLFDGVQAVGLGILRGLDDTKIPTLIAFCSYTLVALPLSYVLSTQTSLREQGVWIGYVVALIIASTCYVYRIHLQTKKGQVS